MPESEYTDVHAILDYVRTLEQRARRLDDGTELVVEAVLLCAGKVQDMTTNESVHARAVERVLTESDIGSHDTLRCVRGVLRAAAQLDGVHPDLHRGDDRREYVKAT
jgi:hypothetical protein